MKKAYIEPTNTVVRMNPVRMIADSADKNQIFNSTRNAVKDGDNVIMEGREAISTPDVWDEW